MPIVYDFYINGEKVNAEIGFTLQESGEEKLNSGSLKIVNTRRSNPYPMLSLVEIDKKVLDNHDDKNIIDREISRKLLISDTVEQAGSYGYYNHSLNIIEYTHKLDYYLQASLVESFGIIDNRSAPFIYKGRNKELKTLVGGVTYTNEDLMPPIKVNSVYRGNFKLKATGVATISVESSNISADIIRCKPESFRTFIRFSHNNEVIDVTNRDVDIELPPGEWSMDYGYIRDDANIVVYTYKVRILSKEGITVYDLVMNVRNNVSKYGGIESKHYFNDTRLFELDKETEEYLKSVEAPQVFLENATARQMLIFVLQYVNALPKLVKEGGIDVLHLIRYNEYEGRFSINDVSGYNAEHNTNQIGSRSYSPLKQVLPNSLDEPTLYTPMKDGYKTVRSVGNQLTPTDFELKLEKPIYKPLKFEVVVPIIYSYRALDSSKPLIVEEDVVLDLTDQLIHKNEWELKDTRKEFPNAKPNPIYSKEIGLLPYKHDSFYWSEGDTSIKMANVFGDLFKTTHLDIVIENALRLEFMNRDIREIDGFFTAYPEGTYYNGAFTVELEQYFNTDEYKYSQIKFNLEYITKEDVTIKQDKEDLSEIDFYSEMRLNQEESKLDVLKGSRKTYGDLQRTGNKGLYFVKFHKNFQGMYKVGQTDVNKYTITNITKQYFNEYIIATYELTKHHNRISQATYVDQTYRWRDNYANTASERHEYYGDYIFLLPKRDWSVKREHNKIMNREDVLRIIFSQIGVMRKDIYENNTKATTALVRTDGFLNYYNNIDYYDSSLNNLGDVALSVPVSSFGIKGGFVFTFGFDNNQLAGVALTRRYINNFEYNMFNRNIRYTDFDGSFKYLDFHIFNSYNMNKKTLEDNKNSFNTQNEQMSLEQYPLIEKENLNDINNDNLLMFGTGDIQFRRMSNDSLVVNKDPMTNFKLSYGLNILSYYSGLFIIGQNFFSTNPIVSNETPRKKFLYLYNNGTQYGLFEDLKVKEGYFQKIQIDEGVVVYEPNTNEVNIIGVGGNTTSWAIGDDDMNLDLACNEALDGFEIVDTHFRPNVNEIGSIFKELGEEDDWGVDKPEVPGIPPTEPEFPTTPEDEQSIKLGLKIGIQGNLLYYESETANLNTNIKLDVSMGDGSSILIGVNPAINLEGDMIVDIVEQMPLYGVMFCNVTTDGTITEKFSGGFTLRMQDDLSVAIQGDYINMNSAFKSFINLNEETSLNLRASAYAELKSVNSIAHSSDLFPSLDSTIKTHVSLDGGLGEHSSYKLLAQLVGNMDVIEDSNNIDLNSELKTNVNTTTDKQRSIKAIISLDGKGESVVISDVFDIKGELNSEVRVSILDNVRTKPPVFVSGNCYDNVTTGTRRVETTFRNDNDFEVRMRMNHFNRRVGAGMETTFLHHNSNPNATTYPIEATSYNDFAGQSDTVSMTLETVICKLEL